MRERASGSLPGATWLPLLWLAVFGCSGTEGLGDGVLPPGAKPPACGLGSLCLDWPLPGRDGEEWVIHNYVDHDPSDGRADYAGGVGESAKTYNGHTGTDIVVPTFRAMDADFPVLAAASGTVIDLAQGYFDRNTACTGYDANFVLVRHPGGLELLYLHLKKGSVAVSIGEDVVSGQPLATVGSSGCSTQPHLHFEIRDEKGAVVDPFPRGLWKDPPRYDTSLSVLDVSLQDRWISSSAQVIDPPPNVGAVQPGKFLGVGLSVAGGGPGDTLAIRYLRPNGSEFLRVGLPFTRVYRHSIRLANIVVGGDLGPWGVEILANGHLARSYSVVVAP